MRKWLPILLILFSCTSGEDLKIGFIADFADRDTSFGAHCRNGAQLAVEEINSRGGVRGRKLVLIPENNRSRADLQKEIALRFKDEGIRYVIGPHLSSMASVFLKYYREEEGIIISPTASSDDFTALDDNFFRLPPTASEDGAIIGRLIAGRKGDVALVRSALNGVYTNKFMDGVRETLASDRLVFDRAFEEDEIEPFVSELLGSGADHIVFSSPGTDTAKIIQLYSRRAELPSLYADGWNRSSGILKHGGRAAEGMLVLGLSAGEGRGDGFLDFGRKYEQTYGLPPMNFTQYAYEAVMVLAHVMEEQGFEYNEVKRGLLELEGFNSIMGSIEFDPYGDSKRVKQVDIIKNGIYEVY